MNHFVSVTSPAPSVVIIRQAYERFFSAQDKEVTTSSGNEAFLTIELRASRITAIDVDDWLRFRFLVNQWRLERGAMSSITEAALCPAYQSIIGMGRIAVPFLLSELRSEGDEPDQWFWALKAITGADPVKDEDRGDFVAMSKSWLDWEKAHGDAR